MCSSTIICAILFVSTAACATPRETRAPRIAAAPSRASVAAPVDAPSRWRERDRIVVHPSPIVWASHH